MPKNFSERISSGLRSGVGSAALARDPKLLGRIIVGGLLLANLVVFSIAMGWWGGSPEELEQQQTTLRQQILARRTALQRSKLVATKVDLGRGEGDKFLSKYFLARRTAYSTVVNDLVTMAQHAQIVPREIAYTTDLIDGSDTLSMMSITANYDGTFADIMRFIAEIDRSPRMLIIETFNAAPVQGGNRLSVAMKIDTFVREDGGALPPMPGLPTETPADPKAPRAGLNPDRKGGDLLAPRLNPDRKGGDLARTPSEAGQ